MVLKYLLSSTWQIVWGGKNKQKYKNSNVADSHLATCPVIFAERGNSFHGLRWIHNIFFSLSHFKTVWELHGQYFKSSCSTRSSSYLPSCHLWFVWRKVCEILCLFSNYAWLLWGHGFEFWPTVFSTPRKAQGKLIELRSSLMIKLLIALSHQISQQYFVISTNKT